MWQFIERHLVVVILCLFLLFVLFVLFFPKADRKNENYENITLVISIFALVVSLATIYINFNTYLDSKGLSKELNKNNLENLQRPFFIFEDFEKNTYKNCFTLKFKFVSEKNIIPIYNVKIRAVIDCIGKEKCAYTDSYANKSVLTSTKFIDYILPNKDYKYIINYENIVGSDNNISNVNLSKVLLKCDVIETGMVFVEYIYNNDEKKTEILQYQEKTKQIYVGKNNVKNKEKIENDIKQDSKENVYKFTKNMNHEF